MRTTKENEGKIFNNNVMKMGNTYFLSNQGRKKMNIRWIFHKFTGKYAIERKLSYYSIVFNLSSVVIGKKSVLIDQTNKDYHKTILIWK